MRRRFNGDAEAERKRALASIEAARAGLDELRGAVARSYQHIEEWSRMRDAAVAERLVEDIARSA